jgi:hypothetical protein
MCNDVLLTLKESNLNLSIIGFPIDELKRLSFWIKQKHINDYQNH